MTRAVSATAVAVEVWTDVMCPWCYIGKRRFEAGVAAAGVEVTVTYRSFQLAPRNPVDFDGNYLEYFSGRLGISPDRAAEMIRTVTELAATVGLDYRFDLVRPTNTLLAHQLLQHAKGRGRQAELNELLMRAYFTEGAQIGHEEPLVELAVRAGLDGDDARRALRGGEHLSDVQADVDAARALGIQGVPFYVIDDRQEISGAQETPVFASALRRASEQR